MYDMDILCTGLVAVKLASACVKFCREFLGNLWKEMTIVSSEEFLKQERLWPLPTVTTPPICCVLRIEGSPYTSDSQPSGPGINYSGPREVLLEFVILISKQFSWMDVL